MVKNVDQYVDDMRRHEDKRNNTKLTRCLDCIFPCLGRYLGNYIVILYIIVKIIFIINSILQVFITGELLGQSFILFGYNFIKGIIDGHGWLIPNSEFFPSKFSKNLFKELLWN